MARQERLARPVLFSLGSGGHDVLVSGVFTPAGPLLLLLRYLSRAVKYLEPATWSLYTSTVQTCAHNRTWFLRYRSSLESVGMASFPPQRTGSQHRSSSETTEAAPGPDVPRRKDSPSATSEDSQTVLLNKPSNSSPASQTEDSPSEQQMQSQPPSAAGAQELDKCWICFQDKSEDTPASTAWRTPCKCQLTAHEACLLDWVASVETTNARKRKPLGQKVTCPQCKTEIKISRPRSISAQIVGAVERIADRAVFPLGIIVIGGTVWAGSFAHGIMSVATVFGLEDAQFMLHEAAWPTLALGIPSIPTVLILSRSPFSDYVIPALPVLFFLLHPSQLEHATLPIWPPTPTATFLALPYLKAAYDHFYDRVFKPLEKKWLAEIQPRSGEDGEEGGGAVDEGGEDGANEDQEGLVMELNVEVDVDMDDDNDEDDGEQRRQQLLQQAIGQNAQRQGQDAQNGPVIDDQNQPAGQPQGPAQPAQNQGAADDGPHNAHNHEHQHRDERLLINFGSVTDAILGALVFPGIAAAAGELLGAVLPKDWIAPPLYLGGARGGILRSRWGRSAVGGCLFVVLKDALVLYARWKNVQTHRKRKILDYDREAGKYVDHH